MPLLAFAEKQFLGVKQKNVASLAINFSAALCSHKMSCSYGTHVPC